MEKELIELRKNYKEVKLLQSVRSILSWDQETYMPSGAGEIRSEQIAIITTLAHNLLTSSKFRKLLSTFMEPDTGDIHSEGLSEETHRMLQEIWRDYHKSVCMPADFVREMSKHVSISQQKWSKARKENDFSIFAPYLEKMIQYKKQQAEYLGYENQPYDALLDIYEPGMTTETVKKMFTELKEFLVPFLKKIVAATPVDDSVLYRKYDPEKQWEFGEKILKDMGFDFNYGRQDKSVHPFTSGFHPEDVRLTTRIYEDDLCVGLFGTIHEGGHGLYEQGLDPEYYDSPFGDSISLGIHESQSRLWENLIGRSRKFWKYYYPLLQSYFPENLGKYPLADFYKAINKVKPSLIRVEADEVTYNLHIMLRFDLEQRVINGHVEVTDLPGIWNDMMEEYLGIRPETDSQGILQDIHWSMGSFGYFPTYALGNLYGVQILNAMKKELPDLDEKVGNGELLPIREWLREKIHLVGRRKKAPELIRELTGSEISVRPFTEYISEKYAEIYGI